MTPDDAARMMRLHAQGLTRRQIAQELGVNPVTLWRYLKRHGIALDADLTLRQRRIEAEYGEPLRDVITGFRAMGYDWPTIAGALEVSERQLYVWRKQQGLPVDRQDRRMWQDYA